MASPALLWQYLTTGMCEYNDSAAYNADVIKWRKECEGALAIECRTKDWQTVSEATFNALMQELGCANPCHFSTVDALNNSLSARTANWVPWTAEQFQAGRAFRRNCPPGYRPDRDEQGRVILPREGDAPPTRIEGSGDTAGGRFLFGEPGAPGSPVVEWQQKVAGRREVETLSPVTRKLELEPLPDFSTGERKQAAMTTGDLIVPGALGVIGVIAAGLAWYFMRRKTKKKGRKK